MPHIDLDGYLPGITGPLERFPLTGGPIRDLTQAVMRCPDGLSHGEREVLASVVCVGNQCQFCSAAHIATAARYVGGEDIVQALISDHSSPDPRFNTLLDLASAVGSLDADGMKQSLESAVTLGVNANDIHDTALIAALFAFYNRYVDGLATDMPSDTSYFNVLAERLVSNGYRRPGGQHGTH